MLRKYLYRSLIFNKVAGLQTATWLKKRFWFYSTEGLCKDFKTTLFIEHVLLFSNLFFSAAILSWMTNVLAESWMIKTPSFWSLLLCVGFNFSTYMWHCFFLFACFHSYRYLFVEYQQWKQQKNVWNLSKVNCKRARSLDGHNWRRSGVINVNFEQILHIVLVF